MKPKFARIFLVKCVEASIGLNPQRLISENLVFFQKSNFYLTLVEKSLKEDVMMVLKTKNV